ncbi:glutamate receptor 2.8-like [Argentina anserina]|uniref:glutamate receptor 2.8-like n=1 Tax=Argentina anserina TaxID=57926 RepID=UPI00217693BA|nr:glutamate receptor 2.8-like [Potentilla anserina]
MIKNPTSPVFLLLFLRINIFVMSQNTTLPINVGLILDLDTIFGKRALSCIDMSLSDFYASHANYNTRLVLHTRDSREDIVVAAGAALDLINNVKVQAIIGPESSLQANFVLEVGTKAKVPIISFSATSPFLQGSYFFRIAQNDSTQIKALASIIQAFGWHDAVPITVNNELGAGIIPYMTTAMHAIGVGIPYWSAINPMASDDQLAEELYKLMTMQTRVFILHVLPSLGSRIFAKAKELGMMNAGYVWIMTNSVTNYISSSNSNVIHSMQGVLGLKTYVPNTKELEKFRNRWQRKFQQDNPPLLNAKLDAFGLWAYDAAWALAMAAEKVGTSNFRLQEVNISHDSSDLVRLEVSQIGPQLARELSGIKFRGLSGDFSLVNGQLQSSTYQVINMNENGQRGIGYWRPQDGLLRELSLSNKSTYSTSNASLGPVIWPGDTTSTPKGWEIPSTTGGRLKILVPVNPGFKEFVNVTHDPRTNTSKVSGGYCIEVFEAAIKALPYPVPYDFYPYAKPDGEVAGSYNDLVNQVFLQNYDAAVGDITIRANRSLYVDFTLPYTESGISVIVHVKDNNSTRNTWVFLKPLTWDLWITSACFFIFIGFVVWVLEHRINEDFRGPPHHQIGTSFWFSFSTMIFAHRERVMSNLARFVVIIWCFVVLILIQSYTASLTSFLTVQQLQPTVTDISLLVKNGDTVGYQAGSFVYGLLKNLGFQDEKLKTYSSTDELYELFQNSRENNGISAAFDEAPYMKLFLAKYCSNYIMVEPTFKADGFAFVFHKGSLLARDVSRAITSVHEGADMKNIEDKWFKKEASCSSRSTTGSTRSLTLSLYSFWGLFLIAGVASSLALLIFAAVFLYEHRHTLTSFDPETSFWRRICILFSIYDRRDITPYTRRQLQDSVHGKSDAVESLSNANSSPRPSSEDNSESHIVIQELGTPSDTDQLDLNICDPATQEIE